MGRTDDVKGVSGMTERRVIELDDVLEGDVVEAWWDDPAQAGLSFGLRGPVEIPSARPHVGGVILNPSDTITLLERESPPLSRDGEPLLVGDEVLVLKDPDARGLVGMVAPQPVGRPNVEGCVHVVVPRYPFPYRVRAEHLVHYDEAEFDAVAEDEIQVGDRVRREPLVKGGVAIEFTVHRIQHGFIYPAYDHEGKAPGVGYRPDRFKVVARSE